ncbi:MAG: TRAP transporter substrate-binding protein DctP [Rhodovibrionaceae bacterium]
MMRKFVLAASVAIFAATGATAAVAEEAVLKGAMFIKSDKSLFRAIFNDFAAKVNERGAGTIKIDPILGPEAIPSNEMANALSEGVVDIAGLPPAFYQDQVAEADALQLATVSPAEQRENGAIAFLQERYHAAGWHLLAQYGYDLKFHLFLNEPVSSLADFEGYKLRTTPTYRHFFDELGAVQVETSRGELYTAMERGVVDGYANVMSEVAPAGWDEVSKYRVDPGFYRPIVTITINLESWEALTPEQQAVLEEVAAEVETSMSAEMGEQDKAAGQRMVDSGMEVITLDQAEGEKLVETALDAYWALLEERQPESMEVLRPLLSE